MHAVVSKDLGLVVVLWTFEFTSQNKLRVPFLDFFTVAVLMKTFLEDVKGFVRQWGRVCMLLGSTESNVL